MRNRSKASWYLIPATVVAFAICGYAQMPPMAMPPGGPGGVGGPPTANPAIVAAQQQVQQARTALNEANQNVERYNKEAKAKLAKQDPKWVEANKNLDALRAEKEKVHKDALEKVHDSDAYKEQEAKLKAAQAIIDDKTSSVETVTKATSDAIDARMAISRMETDGVKKSPEVQDVDARYAAADQAVKAMFEDFKTKELPNNHPWQAALDQQKQAEDDLKSAQQALAQAHQAAAAAAPAPSPRSMGSGSSRGSSRGSSGSRGGNRGGGY